MTSRLRSTFLAVAAVFVGCSPGPSGDGSGEPAEGPRPAFATDIPESIVTPNVLETSIGSLRFFDGFPDEATAQAVYDNLDFTRGVEAFTVGMPFASMAAMEYGIRSFGSQNETVLIFETLMDSRSLFLTPNTESVYMMMWMDLEDGPIVLETPPNVLGIVDDAWFHYVTDFGNAGPDRGQGGRFLFLPPGYDGPVPDGYFTYQAETYGHWVVWRGFQEDGDPAPAVQTTKEIFRAYRLDQASNPPEMTFVNVSGNDSFNTIHAMDFEFWNELNSTIQDEPLAGLDSETLGLFASIGLRKGEAFDPDARMRAILEDAAKVGSATVRTLAYRSRDPETFLFENSAWSNPFVGGSHEFITPDGVRLIDARAFFFFYATGITPAMARKMVGVGSQYAGAFTDENGDALDGGKTYRLTLPAGIPAADFWSIVLYDNQTRSMLQTDQQFPSTGSQREGIVVNDDTSVNIYTGPELPDGVSEANWIQTIPGKGFNVLLRLYGPLEPWFEKTWKPGEFEVMD
jgi:hypothetical protein